MERRVSGKTFCAPVAAHEADKRYPYVPVLGRLELRVLCLNFFVNLRAGCGGSTRSIISGERNAYITQGRRHGHSSRDGEAQPWHKLGNFDQTGDDGGRDMLVLTVGLSGTVIGILADDDHLHSPQGSKVGPRVDVLS